MPLFTTPAHPAHVSVAAKQDSTTADPHKVPTFTTEDVVNPTKPVLYLPPLLSSLPENYTAETLSVEYPPLTTDTRLPDIDPASLSLHRALHHFKPLNSAYASTPYSEAFNWDELHLPEDQVREWYCVAFVSRRKQGSNGDPLYEADKKAHEEAVHNGGLIMYWYGVPDPISGLNLATCVWQSRAHAVAANSRPDHLKAVRLAASSYDVYELQRYVLRKEKGETGVTVDGYVSGPVGW